MLYRQYELLEIKELIKKYCFGYQQPTTITGQTIYSLKFRSLQSVRVFQRKKLIFSKLLIIIIFPTGKKYKRTTGILILCQCEARKHICQRTGLLRSISTIALSVSVVLRPASSTVVKKMIYTATSGALELKSLSQN